jgi:hypothetical protein
LGKHSMRVVDFVPKFEAGTSKYAGIPEINK